MILDIKFPQQFKQYNTVREMLICDAIVTESTNEPSDLKFYIIDSDLQIKEEIKITDKEILNMKSVEVANFGVFNCKHRLHVFTFQSCNARYLLRLLRS